MYINIQIGTWSYPTEVALSLRHVRGSSENCAGSIREQGTIAVNGFWIERFSALGFRLGTAPPSVTVGQ